HLALAAVAPRGRSTYGDCRRYSVRRAVARLLNLSGRCRILRNARDGQSVARRRAAGHQASAAREAARAVVGVHRAETVAEERSTEAAAHKAESKSGTAAERTESAVATTSAIEFRLERSNRTAGIEAGAELIEACRRGR